MHVSQMALDSALGTTTRTVTVRPKRPDLDRIVADAKRKALAYDVLPRAGEPPIVDDDNDDDNDDTDAVVSKLMAYLKDICSPEQLEAVAAILNGGLEPEDADEAVSEATKQAADRRAARLAADQARRRPMTAVTEDAYLRLFPNAQRLA